MGRRRGPNRRVVCGSFGYEDAAHPANGFRTGRVPMAERPGRPH
ncbi:hypothetical protein GCM10023165_44450 [Variovorax defluvii]|uniref:Uncharacterized protein n=1 Tax=Variovorax defluvii TaxID=913761 RepID=A0ABP8I9C3_9BURK